MIYSSNTENNMKRRERDGIETVTDYVESEKLHQKEGLEGQFLFLQIKKKNLPKVSGFGFCILCLIFFFPPITVNVVQAG